MDRTWWTVWIKVAVLALVLLLAFFAVKDFVTDTVEPYLLDQPAQTEPLPDDADGADEEQDMLEALVGKVEKLFGIKIDYENFIFDFANQYAQDMMEQSEKEHNQISQPLS